MKKVFILPLMFFIFLIPAFLFSGTIENALEKKMMEAQSQEFIPVNVVMKEQVDVSYLAGLVKGRKISERRAIVVNYLKEIQKKSQYEILIRLTEKKNRDEVKEIRSLWICNAVCFKAKKDFINEIATFPGIRSIDWNEKRVLIKPQQSTPAVPTGREIVWNVSLVEAPAVWGLGYTGNGIIVGLIDTGVRYTHFDLADHIWTNPGEIPNNGTDDDGNGYVDDYYGYDFVNGDSDPIDDYGHGSHCAGTIASDGTAGSQCGVAPDARIMSLKVLDSGGSGTEAGVWEAIQYAIDNGAQIMSLSLGWSHAWNPDRPSWRTTCNNALAAGVNMSIAAGNEDNSYGPPDNVRTPGDCPPPWLHPDQTLTGGLSAVVTIGATDINDVIANFSSRGPVSWEGISPFNDYAYNPEMGLIDPDVCAPGVNIKSLDYSSDNGYVSGWNGTSMATPHVAGAMALILEKNSSVATAFIDSILEVTAVELGTPGKDNVYGSGRIDCYQAVLATPVMGSPGIPELISPFNFVRLPDTQPQLNFYSTDPQSDSIQYRVFWDTDPGFGSPDSSTTALYPSGSIVNFIFPSPLTDGETYWWKVKCTDPGGSSIWTQFTTERSLSIGTALPANTCSWFQNTSAQFNYNAFNGTVIQGDSIILAATGQTVDTIFTENFESGLPPGWTVIDGNSDGYMWTVGTTGDLGSYEPPSFGTQYAYYSDDDAGNDVINNNEEIISAPGYIPAVAESLQIQYGYGFQVWENGETYEVKAKFFNGSWGSWNTIATYTSSVSGTATIDLTPYFPADSVQFEWMYHDETSSSHWGYAAACDNVLLTYSYSLSNDAGTLTGTGVTFNELSTTYSRLNWGKAYWSKADGLDSIGIQVEYNNGAIWQLVPDGILPGNSAGFFTTLQSDFVDISSLDTITYNDLRLVGLFYRKGTDAPTEPALLNWEIGNLTTSETTPPLPFSLLSPPDSTLFNISRPTFVWESTSDAGSGLRDYRVYIEGILRHTGIDTSWTADYDLTEGYDDWYIVAYDSANNGRNSNQTWTVVIDVTPPTTVNLITPADNVYLNNSSVNFVWHKASDNVSGVDHYVIQYALDSGFTQGLFETTTAGTTYTAVLSDTTYYWHVKAVDVATNEGAFSTTWQFEIDTQSPNAPSLTSPVSGVWLTNTSVDFQWTVVTDIGIGEKPELISAKKSGLTEAEQVLEKGNQNPFTDAIKQPQILTAPIRYIIQVDTNAAFTSPLIIDTLVGTSTTEVLGEAFYYWRAMAYDLAGNQGPYATAETFGVDATAPIIDSTVVWTDTGYPGPFEITTKVTDNLSGLDSVTLYYRRDEDATWVMSIMHSSGDWFTDTIPSVANSNDTVRYYIRSVDVATNASTDPVNAPTNFYSFIANMLGVEETAETPTRFDFKVSTLVKGKATFKLSIPDKSSITLKIYDITGRVVCEPVSGIHSSGRYELSFKPLRSGIYFYKLKTQYKNTTGKLVIF